MKKTLSILLVVTMLLAIVVTAIPASAAEVAAPTLDPAKVGNTVITDANREEHQDELFEQGYIPLAENIWPEYTDRFGEGKVKQFNSIFKGGEDIADGGKFFLLEDVTATATFNSEAVKRNDGKSEHWVDNFTLDGCGYSLTINAPLFQVNNNTTIKNLTFKGTLAGTGNKCGSFAAINMWENHGYANFENVTSELVIDSNNRATHQRMAALTIGGESCTFKNVKVIGDHTLNANGGVMDNIGAIVGEVWGNTVFEDCYVGGTTYINSTNTSRVNGIGGFVGTVSGNVTFKNCINDRNIVISPDTVFVSTNLLYDGCDKDGDGQQDKDTSNRDLKIGGFAGQTNETIFENCVNNGTVTVAGKFAMDRTSYKNNETNKIYIGGLVGYVSSTLSMSNCANNAAINVSIDNTYHENSLKVPGENDTEVPLEDDLAYRQMIGGVIGYVSKDATIANCANKGKITLDNSMTSDMGGVIGALGGGRVSLNDVDNNGEIEFKNGAALDQGEDAGMALGGVVGMTKAMALTMENCDNTAAIKYMLLSSPEVSGKYYHTGVNGVGGILGYSYASNTELVSLTNCHNTGALTELAGTTRGSFLGGVVGGVRGVTKFYAYKCSNSSDLTMTKSGWSGVGGIIGQYASIGNWMHSNNARIEATFDVRSCVNNGNISAAGDVGGILGGNNEMAAEVLKMNFYNCVNNGSVTGNGVAAGGIYGVVNSKGFLDIQYCVNNGAITSNKRAGGIIGTARNLTDLSVLNCKNAGAVTAYDRAGGIVGNVEITGKLAILDSYNSAAVKATHNVDSVVAAGILAYASATEVNIDKSVNAGKVTCGYADNASAITIKLVAVKNGVTNYYLAGCATDVTAGTSKTQNEINTIVNGMTLELAGDPYLLEETIAVVGKYVQSDYVEATWTAFKAKLDAANTVAKNLKATQKAIDDAKKALEDAAAALDPKDLDVTEFNKQVAAFEELDRGAYDSNTYLEVLRAIEAAEVIKNTENALQSEFDKAVELIIENISKLADRKPTQGDIDVDQWGDLTLAPLHPKPTTPTTAPTESTPESTEPTESTPEVTEPTNTTPDATQPTNTSATTAATATQASGGGCFGLVGGAAIVTTVVLALGAGISLKKKD